MKIVAGDRFGAEVPSYRYSIPCCFKLDSRWTDRQTDRRKIDLH